MPGQPLSRAELRERKERRDRFAEIALSALAGQLVARRNWNFSKLGMRFDKAEYGAIESIAQDAYRIADAMEIERDLPPLRPTPENPPVLVPPADAEPAPQEN